MIKETYVMTAPKSVDRAGFLREQLESASPDLLRDMVKTFADALMSAEADVVCGAPYTFVWCDAPTIKVREGGRTVSVHALVAVGVNADGGREVLGLDVAATEDGAGWLAFLRSLTARG